MKSGVAILGIVLLCAASTRTVAQETRHAALSDDEEDLLREAQDPNQRIVVYLQFEQTRLERMKEARSRPQDMDAILSDYISLLEEMKNWIQDQYNRRGDMRKGLQKLLEQGPNQRADLLAFEPPAGAPPPPYAGDLRDALDDWGDALDGSAKALQDQIKLFGELKQEEKAEKKATAERIKEEKKRQKEEEKLRKKERSRKAPPDQDDN